MGLIGRGETPAEALERLADLTDGLPFDECDTPADLIEGAIRLAHQHAGAVDALERIRDAGPSWPLSWSVADEALRAMGVDPSTIRGR